MWPGLDFFYTAFLDLTTDRNYEMGPVGWSSIDRYSERYRLGEEQREDLFYHLQRMDKAYMDWQRDRSKAKSKSPAKKAPKRR